MAIEKTEVGGDVALVDCFGNEVTAEEIIPGQLLKAETDGKQTHLRPLPERKDVLTRIPVTSRTLEAIDVILQIFSRYTPADNRADRTSALEIAAVHLAESPDLHLVMRDRMIERLMFEDDAKPRSGFEHEPEKVSGGK